MRKWRVVRVTPKGTLYVAEQQFWSRKGAQAAATHLNTTFGGILNILNQAMGHNFFAAHADKISMMEQALEESRKK